MAVHVLCTLVCALLAFMARTGFTKGESSESCGAATMPLSDMVIPPNKGNNRITGGLDAVPGQFPHMAFVFADGWTLCGGSLVSKKSVLTAAHCTVKYKKFTIRLGGVHRKKYEYTAWTRVSPWFKAHPQFGTNGHNNNDIAIIFLPEEPPLTDYIKLVALPSRVEVYTSFAGNHALLSGWGKTSTSESCSEILKWTGLYVIPNQLCKLFYMEEVVTRSTLCAIGFDTGACHGDSGSPLVIGTLGSYKQIGVLSFGPAGCDTETPNGYTRVTSFLDWITTTAGIRVQ